MFIVFMENDCRCTKPKETQGKAVQRDTIYTVEI